MKSAISLLSVVVLVIDLHAQSSTLPPEGTSPSASPATATSSPAEATSPVTATSQPEVQGRATREVEASTTQFEQNRKRIEAVQRQIFTELPRTLHTSTGRPHRS